MDDLVVFHRHPDGPAEMQLVHLERNDPVVVSHMRCSCGSQRAIVTHLGGDHAADPQRTQPHARPYRERAS